MEILIKVHTENILNIEEAMSLLGRYLPIENETATDAVVSPIPDPSPPIPEGEMKSHGKIMELQASAAADAPPASPPAADVFKATLGTIPPATTPIPPPATTPIPPPAGVETDSSGTQWDKRIHSSSKGKLVRGGTWKMRRGVDPKVIADVLAEALSEIAAPGAPATIPPPPVGDMNEDFQKLMGDAIDAGKSIEDCDAAALTLGVTGGMASVQKTPSKIPEMRKLLGLDEVA